MPRARKLELFARMHNCHSGYVFQINSCSLFLLSTHSNACSFEDFPWSINFKPSFKTG